MKQQVIVEVIMPTPVRRAVAEACGIPGQGSALLRTVTHYGQPVRLPAPVRTETALNAEAMIKDQDGFLLKHTGAKFVRLHPPNMDYSRLEARLLALTEGKEPKYPPLGTGRVAPECQGVEHQLKPYSGFGVAP